MSSRVRDNMGVRNHAPACVIAHPRACVIDAKRGGLAPAPPFETSSLVDAKLVADVLRRLVESLEQGPRLVRVEVFDVPVCQSKDIRVEHPVDNCTLTHYYLSVVSPSDYKQHISTPN